MKKFKDKFLQYWKEDDKFRIFILGIILFFILFLVIAWCQSGFFNPKFISTGYLCVKKSFLLFRFN